MLELSRQERLRQARQALGPDRTRAAEERGDGAALVAATAAVFLDRALAARRSASATAT